MHRNGIVTLVCVFAGTCSFSQQVRSQAPDLVDLIKARKITVYNRTLSLLMDPEKKNAIHLDEQPGVGVAWFTDMHVADGTIEFDVKGRNKPNQSFVGLAFHAPDDSTMEVVYFRPFNFENPDTPRRKHAVQYISVPGNDWEKLRTDFPGKYEQPLLHAPAPGDWFHVRLLIENSQVAVYVNDNPKPDLVVHELSNRKDGMIGFWVGNNSAGDFANIKIKSK